MKGGGGGWCVNVRVCILFSNIAKISHWKVIFWLPLANCRFFFRSKIQLTKSFESKIHFMDWLNVSCPPTKNYFMLENAEKHIQLIHQSSHRFRKCRIEITIIVDMYYMWCEVLWTSPYGFRCDSHIEVYRNEINCLRWILSVIKYFIFIVSIDTFGTYFECKHHISSWKYFSLICL